jgi:hypothetical protein
MFQRVRCPHCHHWTDALLVWAAGDCCPSCNAPMTGFSQAAQTSAEERSLRPPPGLSRSRPDHFSESNRISDTG